MTLSLDIRLCSESLITQVCDQKTFLTRVAVSYAFVRADNGKNSEKVPSRTIFAQISIFDFGTEWITTGCYKSFKRCETVKKYCLLVSTNVFWKDDDVSQLQSCRRSGFPS